MVISAAIQAALEMSDPRTAFVEAMREVLREIRQPVGFPYRRTETKIRAACEAYQNCECDGKDTEAECFQAAQKKFRESGGGVSHKFMAILGVEHADCRAAIIKEVMGE